MVRLMLTSILVMLASIFALYLAPLSVAPWISASLYIALWAQERRLGVASPITRLMSVFYLLLASASHWTADASWLVHAAPVVYWTMAVLILALLIAGRPFTSYYAGGAGFPPLQTRVSMLWGGLHAGAGACALALFPGLGFIFLPVALMILGALATLWLNFISMGPAFGRQPRFDLDGYTFREAVGSADREIFHDLIANSYRADLQRELGMSRKLAVETILREHRATSDKWRDCDLPFLAFAGGRPVGGICIFFDHGGHGLPIECEAQIDLAAWRAIGPIAEVGRLGVDRRNRFSPALLRGLFKCVVEAAVERNVHFLFNDSFDFQAGMYRKIGFTPLHEEPYVSPEFSSTGYGLKALPMMMNLAGMVRIDSKGNSAADLHDILAPYVGERFFKHLVLRELVRSICFRKNAPKEIANVGV